MKNTPGLLLLVLAGCSSPPAADKSFVSEKTPAAAALAGERPAEGSLEERMRDANRKNDERLLKGDWRAAKPAVGPNP